MTSGSFYGFFHWPRGPCILRGVSGDNLDPWTVRSGGDHLQIGGEQDSEEYKHAPKHIPQSTDRVKARCGLTRSLAATVSSLTL